MNEIIGTILTALLAALVPVIAILLKVLGQKLAAFIQAKIDNQVAEGILVRLDEAAFSAVGEVWQTMGEAMKAAAADGKFTAEEKAALKAAAISSVKAELGQKGIDTLLKVLGWKSEADADKAIGAKVENAIYRVKRANANRIEPVTMAR